MKEIEREGNRNAKRLLSRRRCTQSKTQHSFNTTTFFFGFHPIISYTWLLWSSIFSRLSSDFLTQLLHVNGKVRVCKPFKQNAWRLYLYRWLPLICPLSLSHFSQLYCWTHLIYFMHQTDTENGVHIVLRPGLHFISQTNNNNHGKSPIPKFWTVDCVFVDKFLLNAVRFQHWQNVHHFNCSLQYSHEWFCLMKTVTHIPILQIHIRIDTQPVISSVVCIS